MNSHRLARSRATSPQVGAPSNERFCKSSDNDLMPVPLYQAKAEFFRMLGHPVRIRVLELLQDGPMAVRDLLADLQIEASSLSQQLAVLRRSGIVTAPRDGSTVVYALA